MTPINPVWLGIGIAVSAFIAEAANRAKNRRVYFVTLALFVLGIVLALIGHFA